MTRRPLFSIQDLSDFLQIPVNTIYRWNSRGGGPPFRKVGRHVRYLPDEVDRWLQDQPSG